MGTYPIQDAHPCILAPPRRQQAGAHLRTRLRSPEMAPWTALWCMYWTCCLSGPVPPSPSGGFPPSLPRGICRLCTSSSNSVSLSFWLHVWLCVSQFSSPSLPAPSCTSGCGAEWSQCPALSLWSHWLCLTSSPSLSLPLTLWLAVLLHSMSLGHDFNVIQSSLPSDFLKEGEWGGRRRACGNWAESPQGSPHLSSRYYITTTHRMPWVWCLASDLPMLEITDVLVLFYIYIPFCISFLWKGKILVWILFVVVVACGCLMFPYLLKGLRLLALNCHCFFVKSLLTLFVCICFVLWLYSILSIYFFSPTQHSLDSCSFIGSLDMVSVLQLSSSFPDFAGCPGLSI